MRYGSVCSGIEAASVAWEPLGWKASWLAEIEKFPSAVLDYHYPYTPNLGDITADDFLEKANENPSIDVLVGGTPCQSFSVAGLRKGLDDERGNLALQFCRIANALRPRWLIWENVPGVLSSNGGRDFGAILGAFSELGYGWAYRILDAQNFGVPQRRRRVFVVGHSGDWRCAAAVLFERESLFGNPKKSRKTREGTTGDAIPSVEATLGTRNTDGRNERGDNSGNLIPSVDATLGGKRRNDLDNETYVSECALRLNAHANRSDYETENFVVNAREDPIHCSGKSLPLGAKDRGHAICTVNMQGSKSNALTSEENISPTLNAMHGHDVHAIAYGIRSANTSSNGIGVRESDSHALDQAQPHAIACFSAGQTKDAGSIGYEEEKTPTLRGGSSGTNQVPSILNEMQVRRLTPRECERLQGFPDDYTLIPWRKKIATDGPRYKAIGNSMAVPVMRWIGERIQKVKEIIDGDY